MIELFDTHAHLQEPEFSDDLTAVMERARAAGVTRIVLPAVDLASGESALALAERFPGLYVVLGYHPHEASRLDANALERLEALLAEPKVVGVGEIGLDFH